MRVNVVGGGITGLAAALALAAEGVEVTVHEASERVGGKIRTSTFAGVAVDEGPDAFLARVPWATALCRELGLGDELVAPAAGAAWIWSRGRQRRLPEGLLLGIPTELVPLARSGLLSPLGLARAGIEPLLPARAHGDSLGKLIRDRFGDEVLERLVDPLIGGINAGDSDVLSLTAAAPQVAEGAARSRSLLRGLRAQRQATPPPSGAPIFLTVRGGLQLLVDAAADELRRRGGTIETGRPITTIEPGEADATIVATPAHVAGRQLRAAPQTAMLLRKIPHASVAMIRLLVPAEAFPGPLEGSGLLVPKPEQQTITAASWGSSKWPQWQVAGQVVLRVSAGRDGDEHALALDDDTLVERVLADLARVMHLRGTPGEVSVTRWPQAFPQYRPGHLRLVEEIDRTLSSEQPTVVLAGAAYRGIGIPACIRQGQEAAAEVLARRT